MPGDSLATVVVTFVVGAAAAIAASSLLVRRLERVGGSLGLSEALIGLATALAADSPEITSAVTALHSGHRTVGIGVVLGSNLFNLAALLGIGAIVAGRIELHRRVILFEGVVSLFVVAATLVLVTGAAGPVPALVVALAGFLPYCVVIGLAPRTIGRLPLPRRLRRFVVRAVYEEDVEVGPHPVQRSRPEALDIALLAAALLVVVVSSVAMEHAGVALGARFGWAEIVVGGVLLAAVTSLPNAVGAVYLARRGRGAAVLSEALNSNALNVVVGLLLPAIAVGVGAGGSGAFGIAVWYGLLGTAVLALAYGAAGLSRASGALVVVAYAGFVVWLVLR